MAVPADRSHSRLLMAAVASSHFHELLRQLQDEHERQIAELQSKVSQLCRSLNPISVDDCGDLNTPVPIALTDASGLGDDCACNSLVPLSMVDFTDVGGRCGKNQLVPIAPDDRPDAGEERESSKTLLGDHTNGSLVLEAVAKIEEEAHRGRNERDLEMMTMERANQPRQANEELAIPLGVCASPTAVKRNASEALHQVAEAPTLACAAPAARTVSECAPLAHQAFASAPQLEAKRTADSLRASLLWTQDGDSGANQIEERRIGQASASGTTDGAHHSRELVPQFVLCTTAPVRVLAVALSPEASSGSGPASVAVVLDSGSVEVWKRGVFNWTQAGSAALPLPGCACASASFAAGGRLLWLVVSSKDGDGSSGSSLLLFDSAALDSLPLIASGALLCCCDVIGPLPLPPLRSASGELGGGVLGGCDAEGNSKASPIAAVAVALSPHGPLKEASASQSQPRIGVWECQTRSEASSAPAADECNREVRLGAAGGSPSGLKQASSFQVTAASFPEPAIASGLWQLAPGDASCARNGRSVGAQAIRLALWLRPRFLTSNDPCRQQPGVGHATVGQAGELQIRTADSGECLAWLPLGASEITRIVVPPQDGCPDALLQSLGVTGDLLPMVVIFERCSKGGSEWIVAVALGDSSVRAPRPMRLQPLAVRATDEACAEVISAGDGLVGYRTASGCGYILDWQKLQAFPTPDGWQPLAVSRSAVVLLAPENSTEFHGSKLLFLESR